jgi:hypothetical protein
LYSNQVISCACSAAADYYQNGAVCVSCNNPPSGVLASNCKSCTSSSGFYMGSVECIYCPSISFAVGTATVNGCDCKANYYWNAYTDQC